MLLYQSSGILRYSDNPYRLVVEVDQELVSYYRSLIPKYLCVSSSRYPAHITVVRPEKESPKNLELWKKYEGEELDFLYEPIVVHGKNYYWLRVLSKRLEEIRAELGLGLERSKTLTDASYELPPEPYLKFFHTTIANCKI